jgi:hypothetical protein
MRLFGKLGRQGIELVENCLGAEILIGPMRRQSGRLLTLRANRRAITGHQSTDLVACFVERLCADPPDRVRTMAQVGKELVQFRLDRSLHAGKEEGLDRREAGCALAGEMLWLEPSARNSSITPGMAVR